MIKYISKYFGLAAKIGLILFCIATSFPYKLEMKKVASVTNINLNKTIDVTSNLYIESVSEKFVYETVVGRLTGYGPDCSGCGSGKTASSYRVANKDENNNILPAFTITYNDPEFGEVRIVAGDKKYPYGTIVRITNTGFSTEPIIAIVLDRGNSVGLAEDKKTAFDILFATEQEASNVVGSTRNASVKFEILRLGW